MGNVAQAVRVRERAENKSLPGVNQRGFTKDEIARMFSARDDGVSDLTIAKRYGIGTERLRRLIGRRTP